MSDTDPEVPAIDDPLKLTIKRRGKGKKTLAQKRQNRHDNRKRPDRERTKLANKLQPVMVVDPDALEVKRPRDMTMRTFSPTPSQRIMVAALHACNVKMPGISAYIRVNEDTIHKFFRYELEEGYDRTEAALVGVLIAKALAGNMTAVQMLLHSVFGWRTNGKATDGPATIEALSSDQRLALIAALRESSDAGEAGSGTRRKNKADLVATAGATDGGD